jgi:hypothetical protein
MRRRALKCRSVSPPEDAMGPELMGNAGYMTLQDKKTPILPPGMKEHLYKDLDRGLEFD